MPIGVIDSGVGGFSVLALLEQQFPEQEFVYLSDHQHFPYSEKTVAELQTIGEINTRILQTETCNPIVIACNTLTVTALNHLRITFPDTTFVGTVPAVKPAAETLPAGSHIVVLATKNTAESAYLQDLIQPWQATHHWSLLGSTNLVQAIEAWDESAILAELVAILLPIQHRLPIDGMVLGCTHFPFLEGFIKQVLSSGTSTQSLTFFEPSIGIAKRVAAVLPPQLQTLAPSDESTSSQATQTVFINTNQAISTATMATQYQRLKQFLPEEK